MNPNRYFGWMAAAPRALALSAACGALAASGAFAAPDINGIAVQSRVFNDCPTSTFVPTLNWPTSIRLADDATGCTAFANLHIWRLSADGGTTPATFNNNECFRLGATLTLQGTGQAAEAGLQIAPWYAPNTDGRFQVRIPDGEIAAFGGALPFYSFTASQGLTYVENTPIRLEIYYNPHTNTENDPATIEYRVIYNGTTYTSGNLPFTNCNVAEEPIYGCYGILNNARVGGHVQGPNNPTGQAAGSGVTDATWFDIVYGADCLVPAQQTTLGRIKALYR